MSFNIDSISDAGLLEIECYLLSQDYYEFFKQCWDVLEPETPLIDNWHIKYLCDLLQGEIERIAAREPKTKDLIINISPRSLKSKITTVCLNPWAWTRYPHLKFITASHSEGLAIDLAVESRRLIVSDWYQQRWGHVYKLREDQNAKSKFDNDKHGSRIVSSVSARITGRGAHVIICDDPMSAQDACSEAKRVTANDWWNGTMYSRLTPMKIGVRVVIMQRLHEDDLTGSLLARDADYHHICLPAESTDDVSPAELKDNYVDGLFFGENFPRDMLESAKKNMGSYAYASQYLQRPAPAEGNIVKKEWLRFYSPAELPEHFDQMCQSWDMTFKGHDNADYVVCTVWGRLEAKYYLVDILRKKLSFVETVAAVKQVSEKYYKSCYTKLIEDKANGSAVISMLDNLVGGMIAVEPEGTKIARLSAVTPLIEAGDVLIPRDSQLTDEYVHEMISFPTGKHDDMVDSTSQALRYLQENASSSWVSGFYAKPTIW